MERTDHRPHMRRPGKGSINAIPYFLFLLSNNACEMYIYVWFVLRADIRAVAALLCCLPVLYLHFYVSVLCVNKEKERESLLAK